MSRPGGGRRGRGGRPWPALAVLLLVVLLPTIALLWFMGAAMRNERLAVRQELFEIRRARLEDLRSDVHAHWRERAAALERLVGERPAPAAFAEAVRSDLASSLVVLEGGGRRPYPGAGYVRPRPAPPSPAWSAAWDEARRLEHVAREPAEAALRYGELAEEAGDRRFAAAALQARARALRQAGEGEAAAALLARLGREFRAVLDGGGRSVAASALLLLHEIAAPGSAERREAATALAELLADYAVPMPAAQRRFLMHELEDAADAIAFDTLEAEDLAARHAELSEDPRRIVALASLFPGRAEEAEDGGEAALLPSGLPGVWRLSAPAGSHVALFTHEAVEREVAALLGGGGLGDAEVALLSPGESLPGRPPAQTAAVEGPMPGWSLALLSSAPAELPGSPWTYVWIGALAVAATVVAAVLAARALGRQQREARLKNDLLATVSHELKTPLASMRVLVDTLVESERLDEKRTREYLELLSRENLRLSRLIESFLAFSRLQRGKQALALDVVEPGTVVSAAVDSAGERLRAPGCRFECDVAPELPRIRADRDALVTALLNLLDNAWKYSPDEKRIGLSVYAKNGDVCFAVRDEGVGLSRQEQARVFERFYQADRSLTRRGNGCGLGLSIVDHVVRAHGGAVDVESEPGRGSVFTLRIPAAAEEEA